MMDADDDDTRAERLAIRKRAMNMLARREHAPAELAAKLRKREHASDDIEIVLNELVDDGLLSASRYAEALVASHARRGIGPVRIRADLLAVQIAPAQIDRALAVAGIDWHELAQEARVKRFGATIPGDFPARAKQMRFLRQRGFSGDTITAIVGSNGHL